MKQQIVLCTPTETENVCTTCKHFIEFEEVFFCRFFEAFLSPETFCIPCDFQEKIENSIVSNQENRVPVYLDQ
jgi:hypothetical protein